MYVCMYVCVYVCMYVCVYAIYEQNLWNTPVKAVKGLFLV